MKNRFYIVILALVLLTLGCTKTEVADTKEKAVAFQVGSYAPQTKAPEGTASIIDVDRINSFRSRGYLHAVGVPGEQAFFGTAGETITYHAGSPATWTPSHDYFWPKSTGSYVNFISWVGGTPEVNYAESEETWNATFAWNNVTVAPTDNLLWADMAWRYNANEQTYQFNSVQEGVPTLFHHALAQVRFMGRQSNASDGNVSWTVTVKDLSLAAVKNQGSLSMTNTDPGSKQTKAWTVTNWAAADATAPIAATGLDKALTATDQELIDYKSVLPQAVTANMELTVNYTVTTTYPNNDNVKTVVENASAKAKLSEFSGAITAWEMNKRYTYTVVINPDAGIIRIIPVETDWIDEGEYNLNIE